MAETLTTVKLIGVDSSTTPMPAEFEADSPEDLHLLFQNIHFCSIQEALLSLYLLELMVIFQPFPSQTRNFTGVCHAHHTKTGWFHCFEKPKLFTITIKHYLIYNFMESRRQFLSRDEMFMVINHIYVCYKRAKTGILRIKFEVSGYWQNYKLWEKIAIFVQFIGKDKATPFAV